MCSLYSILFELSIGNIHLCDIYFKYLANRGIVEVELVKFRQGWLGMDKVRCSNCKGAKQVAKLGGMLGDCNLCAGSGLMEIDRSIVKPIEVVEPVADIIKQVSNVAAIKVDEPQVKIDPKKAIYKRKVSAK